MVVFNGTGARKSRVLIVSGDPRELAGLKKELMRCFEINIAATGDAALAVLGAYGADAVLICTHDGDLSIFEELTSEARNNSVPFIVLALTDDESLEAAAFTMGAADYAIKRLSGSGALMKRLQLRIQERAQLGAGKSYSPPEEVLRGKTILIAEDVELNRDILAAMFSGIEGLTLDFAQNGAEALELYRRNPCGYAMAFLDIHMPVMDGIAAARAIRALGEEGMRLSIFALSASGSESESIKLCEAAGMNGYLQKPVEYDEFVKLCAEYAI